MSSSVRELVEILRDEFGVAPDFSARLAPLLEAACRAAGRADDATRVALLESVAAAYHSSARRSNEGASRPSQEVNLLVREFRCELRKVDESLKLLGAFLSRIRQRLDTSEPPRVLH